jgi:hypothetical protein
MRSFPISARWNRWIALLVAGVVFGSTISLRAQEAVDQHNDVNAWTCLNPSFFAMSQTFTPTFSRMNFADIYLAGNSGSVVDGEFSLRVLRNGVEQRVSDPLTIAAMSGFESDYFRFNFSNEVLLAAGQEYELELVNNNGTSFFRWCQSQDDTYAGGQALVDPPGGQGTDFLFRTGMQSIIGPPQANTHGPGYVVFESALQPVVPPSGGGVSVTDGFYSGVNFEIDHPVNLRRIGAHLGGGIGSVFGAVVEASGFASVPDPPDLTGPDVLATTLVERTAGEGDEWGDVDLMLEPGWYGVIFGSGAFGATANTSLPDLGESNGPYWNPYSIRQSDGERFFQAADVRIFAEAASEPGTAQARPTFDTTAEQFAGQWIITDGSSDVTGARRDILGKDERALFEFDLSGVPEGANVTGVELRLVPDQLTSGPNDEGPRLFFHGYAGDGVASSDDAANPLNEIGATPLIDTFDPFDVTLDASYVQSLIDEGATHLGLMVRGDNNGHRAHVSTWEDGRPDHVPLLTIAFSLPGDYDGYGTVGPEDYDLWRDEFGNSVDAGTGADGNGDGLVNAADYIVWRNHQSPAGGNGAAVPEPAAGLLLVCGVLGLPSRHRGVNTFSELPSIGTNSQVAWALPTTSVCWKWAEPTLLRWFRGWPRQS